MCRKKGAKRIVVAVPVSGVDTEKKMRRLADEVVILEKPVFFRAVAQAYREWHDVSDEEASRVLKN